MPVFVCSTRLKVPSTRWKLGKVVAVKYVNVPSGRMVSSITSGPSVSIFHVPMYSREGAFEGPPPIGGGGGRGIRSTAYGVRRPAEKRGVG